MSILHWVVNLVFCIGVGCVLRGIVNLGHQAVARLHQQRREAIPTSLEAEGFDPNTEDLELILEIERLDPVYRLTEWARENWDTFTYWVGWKLHEGQEYLAWTEQGKEVCFTREAVRRVYETVARERGVSTPWARVAWHDPQISSQPPRSEKERIREAKTLQELYLEKYLAWDPSIWKPREVRKTVRALSHRADTLPGPPDPELWDRYMRRYQEHAHTRVLSGSGEEYLLD